MKQRPPEEGLCPGGAATLEEGLEVGRRAQVVGDLSLSGRGRHLRRGAASPGLALCQPRPQHDLCQVLEETWAQRCPHAAGSAPFQPHEGRPRQLAPELDLRWLRRAETDPQPPLRGHRGGASCFLLW